METSKERFKKMFPCLFEEMDLGEQKGIPKSVGPDFRNVKKKYSKKFGGYNPNVLDFIRRCDFVQQAEEIIRFLEKMGEISPKYASKLRKKLKMEGIRSFGPKKEDDYYSKHGGI